jgi:hypothetical protein
LSTNVLPIAIPSICVCAAPLTPTAQRSLFILVIPGATAVGGGDFTVVVTLDSVKLLDVESVTIGSFAKAVDATKLSVSNNFFMLAPGLIASFCELY